MITEILSGQVLSINCVSAAGFCLCPKCYAGLWNLAALPFNSMSLHTVPDLFSLLSTTPAHFCIIFLFEGLGKFFYTHFNKMDVYSFGKS